MPLYFTDKKRRWPPSKPVQYILAVALLIIAVAVLVGWLFVRFIYAEPQPDSTPTEDTADISKEDLPDAGYCLIIVEDTGCERFALVQSDPKNQKITVSALSPNTQTGEGELTELFKKRGPSHTAQVVAQTMNLSTVHYMSFSIADIETLFTRLGVNLQFTVPEDVTYKDTNGATVYLTAESRKLTPSQIASLLRYDQWENNENGDNLAADITTAVINECLRTGKSLKGYFELLANTSATDLRIDQFNAYLIGWEYLASINQGTVAQRINIPAGN